nr:sigma-70 family RNA polymerase sigma factor [uncultured Oscillibacter sp.]
MKIEREELLELIRRSREKDLDAQEELVRAVQDRVYYHCKKMLKNKEDAEDTTQTVLMTMIASLDKLKEPAAFWAWVNGITANQCKHLLTAPHKEWQIPEDEEGNSMLESVENLDETLVPEKVLDNEETRRMILGLVDELPPEQRMSVLFYYYDEMSVKQIAEAMDTSEGTVKSRLNYARKSIKAGVEDYERKGVKLYGVSPLVLLVFFLRQEADGTLLDPATAAAVAGQVLSPAGSGAVSGGAAAGGAGAAAEGGASSAGGAASAAAKAGAAAGKAAAAAGTAVKAGISMKLIAGIVAAAIVAGGAVGISSMIHSDGGNGAGEDARSRWVKVINGSNVAAAIDENDSLWMWGGLETPTLDDQQATAGVRAIDGVSAAELGGGTSAIIKTDGSLWMWGGGVYGQLGNGSMESSSEPVRVLDDVAQVSLGQRHAAARKTDGSLWLWGDDSYGQLGTSMQNSSSHSAEPLKVMDGVVDVSCGILYTMAVTEDGCLWAWGIDIPVGFGDYSSQRSSEPIKIMDNVADVDCGDNFAAIIRTDGSLWVSNIQMDPESGAEPENLLEPVKVFDDIAAVSCGSRHIAVLLDDGSLWAWGNNEYGQMGNTDIGSEIYTPAKIQDGVVDVSCGPLSTMVLKSDGSIWISGDIVSAGYEDVDWWMTREPVELSIWDEYADAPYLQDGFGEQSEAPEESVSAAPSYPEAYAAYLTALDSYAEMIDMYARWYEEINYAIYPVAFADVYGDETPEMIFVEADETYPWSESYLTILTYQGGQVSTLMRESWDFYAGSMLTYTLFQSADGKTLYADTGYSTSQQVTERYVFSESAGALTMEQVKELPSMDELVLSNRYAVDAAMTREEAAVFLAENGKA